MLTGRDAEQQDIDELLQQAAAGGGGVLLLRGDPGIGKTALIDYAARRAGPMRVLRATGIEAESELGFAGLYSLLHPVASYLEALPGRQASALRAALGLGDVQAAPDRLAVAAGTHALLSIAAEHGPLLILVDDLHWLDPASQEALLFTLRRLDRDAVACLITLRPGWNAPVGLPCRDLAGLSPDATKRLVEAIAGTRPASEVARRLHAETGGNPLALVEISATLTAAAWERAAELSGDAELTDARLSQAAQAALNGGDLDRVRRLTKTLPAPEQRLSRGRMLAVRGRLDLLTGQMAIAQRELAESADLAAQTDPLLAVERLDQAVSAALEAGLYDEASQAAGRMADLAERSDETARFLADLAHGGLAWLRGDAEDGMALIRQAVARLEANPALAARPERQLDLASAWCDAGHPDRAWPCSNRAVELARDEGAAGRLPRALAWAAWLDGEGGRWARALAYGSQALDLALATGQTYLACYAYTIMANVEAAQGRDDDCLRHANSAEQIATELGLRKLELQPTATGSDVKLHLTS